VYWARRLLVTAVALALVFGLARLLGGTVGDESGPSARPVAADASTSAPSPTTSSSPSTSAAPTAITGPRASNGRGAAVPLASPSGACPNSDVVVSPSVTPPAYGGKPVLLTMTLTTRQSPACTWVVSADSLVVKVTSGEDRIWSTQQCRGAVPKREVVVRRDAAATVVVAWNGQRSDAECSRYTDWALPGFYHVTAAAFGADPLDEQFELVPPLRPTVTRTPSPSESTSGSPAGGPSTGGAARPSGSPSAGGDAGPSASAGRSPGGSPGAAPRR
jgi:hypothetical protein